MRLQYFHTILLATGTVLLLSSQSFAQQVNPTPLRANPYRDGGGSCVYDRAGNVVHTPKGKACRDRSDHSANPSFDSFASLVSGFPPALQTDLQKLLSDHVHISEELTELRQTIKSGKRVEALDAADRIEVEVAEHRRREEDLLRKLSSRRGSR